MSTTNNIAGKKRNGPGRRQRIADIQILRPPNVSQIKKKKRHTIIFLPNAFAGVYIMNVIVGLRVSKTRSITSPLVPIPTKSK